jgi:hypothetical protein
MGSIDSNMLLLLFQLDNSFMGELGFNFHLWRKRETDKQTDTDRERERDIQRQTDIQTDRDRQTETDRQRQTDRDRQTDRHSKESLFTPIGRLYPKT